MRVRRGPIVDEYAEDGEAAVLVGVEVIVLSPLATTLLGLVGDEWTDAGAVAAGLVDAFGAPPDGTSAEAMTMHALRSLAEHRVLVVDDAADL
jgi:hypothetical protein